MNIKVLVAAAIAALPIGTYADEAKKCNLLSVNSATVNYEQVGSDACIALCKSTDGCVAWTYQPHNFNPKTAPGECRLLPDVREEEASTAKFCGHME